MMELWWQWSLLFILFFALYKLSSGLLKSSSNELRKIFLVALPLIFILPLFASLLPQKQELRLEIQKFDELGDVHSVASENVIKKTTVSSEIATSDSLLSQVPTFDLESVMFYFMFWMTALGLVFFLWQYAKVLLLLKESFLLKSVGKVSVFVSDEVHSPMSFWFFRSFVLLPQTFLEDREAMRLALKHEFIHIQKADLVFNLIFEILRIPFFLNPAVKAWKREWDLFVEMRCDESVLLRYPRQIKKYANLLVRTAGSNNTAYRVSLAMAMDANLLRRLQVITEKKKQRGKLRRLLVVPVLSLSVCIGVIHAFAEAEPLQELNLEQLKSLSSEIESELPIEVNEQVLKWVNYYIGSEEGKRTLAAGKARYEGLKDKILPELEKHGLPEDLVGVAFIESNFKRDAKSTMKAAGIWQFIKPTARRFGLRVDKDRDDRLDIKKSTTAAARYYKRLLALPELKSNWSYALIAYNSGEHRLIRSLARNSSRNAFDHQVGDKEYLAKVMAGIIVMKLPKSYVMFHPLQGARVSSVFGYRTKPMNKRHFHKGMDLAMPQGSPIKSPLAGKVVEVTDNYNNSEAYGRVLVIDHGNDLQSRYYHLDQFMVKKGQRLKAGQVIATVGNTGRSTGPHLHIEFSLGDKLVDPELYL